MMQIHEFLLDFQLFEKIKNPFGNYHIQGVEEIIRVTKNLLKSV